MTDPDPDPDHGGPKRQKHTNPDPDPQRWFQLAVVVICSAFRRFLQKAAKKQVEGGWIILNIFPIKQVRNCDGILEQSRARNRVGI